MNSQHIFLLNFIIFLALVLYFVFGRSKPKQPTVLNLKSTPEPEDVGLADEKADALRIDGAKDVTPQPNIDKPKVNKLIQKNNSVFFMYNGHEWEAFEVLGLPKGCDIQSATSHYQNLIRTADPSTFEFFELAYAAILKSR